MIHHGALVCLCVHLQGVSLCPHNPDPSSYHHNRHNEHFITIQSEIFCGVVHFTTWNSTFEIIFFWFLLNLFCSLIFPEPTLIYVCTMWFIVLGPVMARSISMKNLFLLVPPQRRLNCLEKHDLYKQSSNENVKF